MPRSIPAAAKPRAITIAVAVELAVGQMRVAHPARAVSSRRSDHRLSVGLARGHRNQVRGDIGRLGEKRRVGSTDRLPDGWLGREKLLHKRVDRAGFVLEQVMPGLRKSVHRGPRETGAPIPPENGGRRQSLSCPRE